MGILCFEIKGPHDCSEKERPEFVRLVITGGQVRAKTQEDQDRLRRHVGEARWLGFCRDAGTLVGIAAIKKPESSYRNDVFKAAGEYKWASYYELEFGWAYTRPRHRKKGICDMLTRLLMAKVEGEPVFATTRVNNVGMQGILENHDFERIGKDYLSTNGNYKLRLFATEW